MIMMSLASFNVDASFPKSWLNPEEFNNKLEQEAEVEAFTDRFSLFSKNLDKSVQVIKTDEVSKKKWYLQSIKAEIGIENVGKFGIVGAKGETAVEFVWTRTKASKKMLALKHGTSNSKKKSNELNINEGADFDSEISSTILSAKTNEDIEDIAEKFVSSLYASKKINRRGNLKEDLVEKFIEFKRLVSGLAEVPQSSPWWVYKYQLELFIEVSGTLAPGIGYGSGNRLRLEWYRYQKIQQIHDKNAPHRFDSFVANLAQDLEALSVQKFDSFGYSFDAFKIGIGVGAKGNLFIAKGKGSALGALFFRRDGTWTPRPVNPTPKMSANYSYKMVTDGQERPEQILRAQMRQGLSRASDMALTILKATKKGVAENNNDGKIKHFELRVLELELELYGRGYFGPVTMEGIAVAEFFLIKKEGV